MKQKIKFYSIALILLLTLTMLFSACVASKSFPEIDALCKQFFDFVLANDYESAYAMVEKVGTKEAFAPLWEASVESFEGAKSYELKQVGWNTHLAGNGVASTSVSYELTTDHGRICQITIMVMEGIEGIASLNFLDSTEFVQSTSYVSLMDTSLFIFSILSFVFIGWMFIDCLRRPIRKKGWWAVLTLLSVGGTITYGANTFNLQFKFFLLFARSGMAINKAALAVAFTVFVPIGAIVYFFLRKRLTQNNQEDTSESLNDAVSEQLFDPEETARESKPNDDRM